MSRYVPFIMLTACADVKQSVETMLAGTIDLLGKPIPEDRLSEAVRRAPNTAEQWFIERDAKAALDSKTQRLTNGHNRPPQQAGRKFSR